MGYTSGMISASRRGGLLAALVVVAVCVRVMAGDVSCSVFGRPRDADYGITLPDGRGISQICAATAVIDPEVAGSVFQNVVRMVEGILRLEVAHTDSIRLIHGDEMSRLTGKGSRSREWTAGLFTKRGRTHDVYLLSGLPFKMAYGVLSHEYAHAWQALNARPNLTDEEREGFAEWVAYKVLAFHNYIEEAERLKSKPAPYGTGLVRMLAIEAGSVDVSGMIIPGGPDAVIASIRR